MSFILHIFLIFFFFYIMKQIKIIIFKHIKTKQGFFFLHIFLIFIIFNIYYLNYIGYQMKLPQIMYIIHILSLFSVIIIFLYNYKSFIKLYYFIREHTIHIIILSLNSCSNVLRLISILIKILKLEVFIYCVLILLLALSIVSGYLLSDIFLGLSSNFFSNSIFINPIQNQIFFEKHFEIFFIKIIPLINSFFFFFFFDKINFLLKKSKYLYYFFKLKFYFDFIINFFLLFFYKYSYILFFKQIDKGFLEILGPYGLIRYFYFLTMNLYKLNISIFFNYICLIFFIFTFSLIF